MTADKVDDPADTGAGGVEKRRRARQHDAIAATSDDEAAPSDDEMRRRSREARAAVAELRRFDGTETTAVSRMTGLSVEELDDLGGLPK